MITHPNVKVNVGLNVLRRRNDGYHDLETLFFPCFEISDVLEIVTGDDYARTAASILASYGPAGVPADAPRIAQKISPDGKLMMTVARAEGVDWDPLCDLTARAYWILDADFGLPPVKIWLEKRSPVGAGLGGGSSDAAFALRMMNEMFSLGLGDAELAGYASRLGSDCAFFIYNRPMFGEGRGEILSEYPLPVSEREVSEGFIAPGFRLKTVVPEGISVSTAEAYAGIKPAVPDVPLREILSRPVSEWKDSLENDFEKTVFAAHPELSRIKRSLYDSGAVYASMSGSGSALFAIYAEN